MLQDEILAARACDPATAHETTVTLVLELPAALTDLLMKVRARCRVDLNVDPYPGKLGYHVTVKSPFQITERKWRGLIYDLEEFVRLHQREPLEVRLQHDEVQEPKQLFFLKISGGRVAPFYEQIYSIFGHHEIVVSPNDGMVPHCTLGRELNGDAYHLCRGIFMDTPLPDSISLNALALYEKVGGAYAPEPRWRMPFAQYH